MEAEKKEGQKHHAHEDAKDQHVKNVISDKINLWTAFLILVLLLGIFLIIINIQIFGLNKELKANAGKALEASKPARLELVVIKNSECSDCFDISQVISYVKESKVEIAKESAYEFDSKEGKSLVDKYKIEKIPAVIITGEIEKVSLQGLDKKEDALLFVKPLPPYTNVSDGKIQGRVFLSLIKSSACEKCNNLNSLITQIKSAGLVFSEEKNIDSGSKEGESLIQMYKIEFVPAIVMSKDASVYPVMQQAWPQIGTKESDGSYVLRMASPPYINLTTRDLRGIAGIVYLTDKNCSDCYDVNLHRQILVQNFGIYFEKEETVDISDSKGKSLIEKYNITKVPTVILNGDLSAYPSGIALKQVYSLEKDNSYVFRSPSVVGTYKDLTTSEVVTAQQDQEGAQQQEIQ